MERLTTDNNSLWDIASSLRGRVVNGLTTLRYANVSNPPPRPRFLQELRVLQEKDTTDKDKAISVAAKAAKKLKRKGGKKKKK